MSTQLNETQQAVLRALCDTFVPCISVPEDPTGFWARTASDLGVDCVLAKYLVESVPDKLRSGLLGLLDALAARGFVKAPQDQRERILDTIAQSSSDAARGITFYEKQILLLTYGLPENPVPNPNLVTYGSPQGQNPNWEVLGYPGPVSVPRDKPKQIQTVTPEGDRFTLEADVCVVGSGAGGAVIAAKMAVNGRRVVVLEMGGHYNSADFHQLELWGYRHLWYRGGATPTADGHVTLLAGSTLGGGTEVNWMNCVRTPPLVRQDWARQYGLAGIDTPEFDRYMDAAEQRISSGTQTAYFNAQNLRMREGCQKLGYATIQTHVNWDPKLFNPLMAGYTGFGDQTGGKQTARRTFLLDAYQSGARIVVNCRADRILVDQRRAVGVEATYSDPQGRKTKVFVSAPQVVLACGALESPALLLRSGVGGPAVGKYLRLQPGGAVYGVYKEKQRGWWGSPMTTNCVHFINTGDGFGFYMETPAIGPGFVASVIPWTSGRQHKQVMTKVPYVSTFIWFLRDRGSGQVAIDEAGNSVVTYQLSDEIDQKNFRQATAEAIRIHEAAGAQEVLISLAHKQVPWRRGQNLEGFIQTVMKLPLLDGAQPMISAHQLCSCRMGKDPATSVADANGELRDVKGVWVGDGSAFPTALGANPMVTIMALAQRTADKMAACYPQNGAAGQRGQPWRSTPNGSMRPADNSLTAMAVNMSRAMLGLMNPLNALTFGQRLLTGSARLAGDTGAMMLGAQPGSGASSPMFGHIIELTAKPGQGRKLVDLIGNPAIPRIIQPAEGFVDEIVLLSDTDPNHVTAISFWQSREVSDRFDSYGFDQVTNVLQDVLAAPPMRRPFDVGASTNPRIRGWASTAVAGRAGDGMTGSSPQSLDAISTMAVNMMRGMVGLMNPLNMLTLGTRVLTGRPGNGSATLAGGGMQGSRQRSPMFSHIIEMDARPGPARDLVNAIRDQAIPRIIRPSQGFVDEIVLLSVSDPNHVTAFSFWRAKEDGERFYATGFAQVSALLQPFLSAKPQRKEFIVGVSTNNRIVGWGP
jgi:choline dehydrogenase-like flavoprotein